MRFLDNATFSRSQNPLYFIVILKIYINEQTRKYFIRNTLILVSRKKSVAQNRIFLPLLEKTEKTYLLILKIFSFFFFFSFLTAFLWCLLRGPTLIGMGRSVLLTICCRIFAECFFANIFQNTKVHLGSYVHFLLCLLYS